MILKILFTIAVVAWCVFVILQINKNIKNTEDEIIKEAWNG